MDTQKGFSLIESLLSLGFTLVIVLAGLEFFGVSRNFFLRLKDRCENRRAALAALDKIESDIGLAGRDLAEIIGRGLVEGMSSGEDRLRIEGAERPLAPRTDIEPGQSRIAVADSSGITRGREVVFADDLNAQVSRVVGVEGDTILIDPEAGAPYGKDTARIFLLTRVDHYLDAASGVIRRKENGGGGQPLLESVARFATAYDEERNIVSVRLAFRTLEEKPYERIVFPKNMARTFRK